MCDIFPASGVALLWFLLERERETASIGGSDDDACFTASHRGDSASVWTGLPSSFLPPRVVQFGLFVGLRMTQNNYRNCSLFKTRGVKSHVDQIPFGMLNKMHINLVKKKKCVILDCNSFNTII